MKFQLYLDDSSSCARSTHSATTSFPIRASAQSAPTAARGGRSYRIRVDAQETYGDAQLQFVWSPPHETLEAEAVKAAQQADAVVMVLGLTARLEGEEMPVQIDGFRGGDRTRIDLPAAQQRLLERIVALGKPTVLVLMNGSARRGELGAGSRAGDRRGVVSGPGRRHARSPTCCSATTTRPADCR